MNIICAPRTVNSDEEIIAVKFRERRWLALDAGAHSAMIVK